MAGPSGSGGSGKALPGGGVEDVQPRLAEADPDLLQVRGRAHPGPAKPLAPPSTRMRPSTKFITGLPTKPVTKVLAGASKTRSGVSYVLVYLLFFNNGAAGLGA